MGKKGGGGGGEAAQARADEQERQARIRAGTERVNQIFDGRTVGSGRLSGDVSYDPTKTYYTADGSVWKPNISAFLSAPAGGGAPTSGIASAYAPNGGGGGGGGGGNPASGSYITHDPGRNPFNDVAGAGGGVAAQRPEPVDQNALAERAFREALGGGLYTGTSRTSGFGDDFFGQRRQAFLDYATPQLDEQYQDANKQLTYSLARSGLLDSSVRAEKGAELQKKYDLNKQQIADQALSYETEARNNVEKARSDLITMLNATGDAEGAANSAMARAQALSAPQAFSPLTQLFADFTSGLAQQAGYERANAMGGTGIGQPQIGRYNTGLFSNTKSIQTRT